MHFSKTHKSIAGIEPWVGNSVPAGWRRNQGPRKNSLACVRVFLWIIYHRHVAPARMLRETMRWQRTWFHTHAPSPSCAAVLRNIHNSDSVQPLMPGFRQSNELRQPAPWLGGTDLSAKPAVFPLQSSSRQARWKNEGWQETHSTFFLLSGSGFGRFDIPNVNFKDAQALENSVANLKDSEVKRTLLHIPTHPTDLF